MNQRMVEVLEIFADGQRQTGVRLVVDGLRISNRRRDNETTSEFRRERREAANVKCACGMCIEPNANAPISKYPQMRCPGCKKAHRAAKDRARCR